MLGGEAGERVSKAWADHSMTDEQKCSHLVRFLSVFFFFFGLVGITLNEQFAEFTNGLYVIYLDNAEDLLTDDGKFLVCALDIVNFFQA